MWKCSLENYRFLNSSVCLHYLRFVSVVLIYGQNSDSIHKIMHPVPSFTVNAFMLPSPPPAFTQLGVSDKATTTRQMKFCRKQPASVAPKSITSQFLCMSVRDLHGPAVGQNLLENANPDGT